MITLARVRRIPAPLLLLALFSLPAHAQFGGTGADGAFAPTGNVTLNPDEGGASGRNGEFHYTSFYVPEGTVTTIRGEYNGQPTKILVQGDVQIDGRLIVDHGYSMGERRTNHIGYPGSCDCSHASHSILSPNHSTPYNSEYLHLPLGGPSGFPHNDSHRGGGFIEVEAAGSILIAGSIEANGQDRGAGGAISLRSSSMIYLAPDGYLHAHSGEYDNGYIRIESDTPPILEGEMRPAPALDSRQRMLGDVWTVSTEGPGEFQKTTPFDGQQVSLAALGNGFGVSSSLRGALWISFPDQDQIHPYGRDGLDLLPGKVISTGGNSTPRGIAVDRLDRVWVACTESHRLQYFDPAGRQRLNIGLQINPYAVAVDQENECWVTCTGAGRLYQYTAWGQQLTDMVVGESPKGIAGGPAGLSATGVGGGLISTLRFL